MTKLLKRYYHGNLHGVCVRTCVRACVEGKRVCDILINN